MITSRHKLSYCELCETKMIKCGTCGNNCCNGMSGPPPNYDGSCKDCDDAYNVQDAYYKDPNSVQFIS